MTEQIQRRPIPMRQAPISALAASTLVNLGLSPNQVSILSSAFALAGAACFLSASAQEHSPSMAAALLVGAAFCILGRLLCNMLDGMMAVEYGKRTATGELYNEIPDRISDTLLLASAGYLVSGELAGLSIFLGWCASALALFTAYIRAFGARYLPSPDYSGPMAKPQRMSALIAGALFAALQINFNGGKSAMIVALVVICLGTAITCMRRTSRLANAMKASGTMESK